MLQKMFKAWYTEKGNHIHVAFRGTLAESIANWLTNVKFIRQKWKHGTTTLSVHSGFLQAYLSVSADVKNFVYEAMDNGKCTQCSIIVTGHSLGGAMAQIAALDMRQYTNSVHVITFGSPRVGGPDFATYFAQTVTSHLRMVNENDIVTKLPTTYILGYRHTTQEVWYRKGQHLFCDKTNGEDPKCSRSVNYLFASLDDHVKYNGLSLSDGAKGGCVTEYDANHQMETQVVLREELALERIAALASDPTEFSQREISSDSSAANPWMWAFVGIAVVALTLIISVVIVIQVRQSKQQSEETV